METRVKAFALTGMLSLLSIGAAHGQSLDSLTNQAGSLMGGGGSSGLLSSLSSGSFSPNSLTNLTGVLSYCQENGYLGSPADIAKDRVMDRIGISSEPTDDSDYQAGLSGILQGDGESFDLRALGDQAGERACGFVADHAMSLVGG